jgi:ectoine hydroxylase-related dioxygenase (phytanoyl-CoA dioxygenase family)
MALTQEQKYLFDLMGYVVLEQILTQEELAELNSLLDDRNVWEEERKKRTESAHFNELKMHIGPLLDWGAPFRRLMSHTIVLSVLRELIGEKMRLDHEYAIFMKQGGGENQLHGGGTPYDPAQYYHYRNERMYNGLIVVSFALTDANAGDGGFCCIPGSHKSNIPAPHAFRTLEKQGLWLIQPPLKAGDVLIFTEALTHGTLPWTSTQERRALLYKYSPGHQTWGRTKRVADETMDETQRLLMEPPYVHNRAIVVPNAAEEA